MMTEIDLLTHNNLGFLFENEVMEIADKYGVTPRKVKRDIQSVLVLFIPTLF